MLDDDYTIESHLEAEGVEDVEGPKIAMTDGGESLEDTGDDEGRLSGIKETLNNTKNKVDETLDNHRYLAGGGTVLGIPVTYIAAENGIDAMNEIGIDANNVQAEASETAYHVGQAIQNGGEAFYDVGHVAWDLGEIGLPIAAAGATAYLAKEAVTGNKEE